MMYYKKKAVMIKEMEAIEDVLTCRLENLNEDLNRYLGHQKENPDDEYWKTLVDETFLRVRTLEDTISFIAEDTKYLPWNKDLKSPI